MGPEYEDEDEIPPFPVEDLEGDGWEREPDDELDHIYVRYNGDVEEAGVFVGSGVAESADEASEGIDRIFRGVQKEEFELADEAYWGEDAEIGIAGFRHSNAWAVVFATRRSGLNWVPDSRTAIDLAEQWFEDW